LKDRVREVREVEHRGLAALGMSEADGEIVLSAPADERRGYKLVFIGSIHLGETKLSIASFE
jgi:hypothetical protein